MRDRRNTNLSTSSIFSTDSSLYAPSRLSLSEKQIPSPPRTLSPSPEPGIKENHPRPNASSSLSAILRSVLLGCGIFAIWYYLFARPSPSLEEDPTTNNNVSSPQEMWSTDAAPTDDIVVLKISGSGVPSRWTVQIPHTYNFPLQSKHVKEICKRGDELRDDFSQQSRVMAVKGWRKGSYYAEDRSFLNVAAAQSMGVLPAPEHEISGTVCERSLTFTFDVDDDSFGKSLLTLWLSYGLAKTEGRAFFIDDTRWLYGRWTSFFAPPPQQTCLPPPRHEILPCPHNAQHLLVSSATVPWTFGPSFERHFFQTWKTGAEKSQRIFELLRAGFEDLFHLTGEHALYAASRSAKFREDARLHGSGVIGVHLRRGDLHPYEYQFSQDYLPIERYGSAAHRLVRDSHENEHADMHLEHAQCPLLLATDDPEIFDSTELHQSTSPFRIQKVQERIQLATKATLDVTSPVEPVVQPGSVYKKQFENSGWEGGFYSALFFALGKPNSNKAGQTSGLRSDAWYEELFSEEAVQMRELVGRAYLLDLAVLGSSDGIVCASSSATCRLLGVMLGWDAVKNGMWVNVDDNRAWSWDGRR